MKIAILCGQVEAGGVERVNTTLATAFLKDHHEVTYVSIIDRKNDIDVSRYPFKIVFLEAKSIKRSIWTSIGILRELKPDIILTSILDETFFALLYKQFYNKKSRVVYVQHTVWSTVCSLSKKGYFFNIIMPRVLNLFKKMDAIVYVSNGVKQDMKLCIKGIDTTERTIYNPITYTDKYFRYKPIKKNHIKIVTAGRLSTEKRQDLLIIATKLLLDKGYKVDTYIYGEGSLKDELIALAKKNGINNNIHLMGYSYSIQVDLSKYDIFVLSSMYESFGNVIVEAMNTGLPVVSTDCPVGPRELLANGKFGILIPINDAKALAEGIEQCINNTTKDNIDEAFNRSMQFSTDISTKSYEKLFEEILRK